MLCRLCIHEWLPAISANKVNYEFKKGEVIFKEGDEMTGIYFVYDGKVKVHKHWDEEKELIIRFAKKGDIFGHRGLGNDLIFPVSATALENTTVCFIDREFFYTSVKINNEFLLKLMLFFAEELRVSEKRMRDLAHMQVKGRVANALIVLKNKFGTDDAGNINIRLSRQDFASYAGTTYETVFRIMNELSEEKILKVSGKDIAILDEELLSQFTKQQNED